MEANRQPITPANAWREHASEYERGFIDGMQKQAQSSVDKAVNAMCKREWVGLTDEEIEQEFGFIDELLRDCVQRTEAKLKEKNNG